MSFNNIRSAIKINIILILFPSPPYHFLSFLSSCCSLSVRACLLMSDKPFKSQCSGPRHRIKKGRQVSTNHSSISCYNHHGGRASLAHHSIVRWADSHIGIYTRFLLGYHPRSAILRYLATYAVVTSLATYLGPRGCTGHAHRVAIKTVPAECHLSYM
jgi:hypothetical protein